MEPKKKQFLEDCRPWLVLAFSFGILLVVLLAKLGIADSYEFYGINLPLPVVEVTRVVMVEMTRIVEIEVTRDLEWNAGGATLPPHTESTPTLSPETPIGAWEFNGDGDTEGWETVSYLAGATTSEGALKARITGPDSRWASPNIHVEAANCPTLELRYRISGAVDNMARIHWRTDQEPAFGNGKYVEFPIVTDNAWRTATIDFTDAAIWAGRPPKWDDVVIQFWLDPVRSAAAGFVEIDYVRLNCT